jgi:hypothetical protein
MTRLQVAAPLSSAVLSGVLIEMPCERTVLAKWLAERGPLGLASKAANHPVYCELWSVRDGGLCVGSVSQHDLWEAGGRASGLAMRAMAQMWAPRQGPLRDMLLGNAQVGADLLPGLFRSFSRGLVAPLSTYFETMTWIPGVTLRGSQEPYSFVVGMFTDSAVARWADVAFGYGYRKQPARFDVRSPEAFAVRATNGAPLIEFARARGKGGIGVDQLERAAQYPLLGLTPSGALARSTLKRSFATAESLAPLRGAVELAPGLVPGVRTLPTPSRAHKPYNALAFSNMRAVVSYPKPAVYRS